MTAKYRLRQRAFIEPFLLEEGTVVFYDGAYGPHLEPMNEEATTAADAYFTANPEATLAPVDNLEITPRPQVAIVPPKDLPDVEGGVVDLTAEGSLADPGKAAPGPTDGGKVLPIKG